MPTDFYDVLGVPADASSEEVKRAYRERVREYHPDVNDHPEGDAQFKLIRKANDVLSDPAERKDYDRMGHREYVEKRLDDLPPFSVFPEFDEEDTSSTSDTSSPSEARSEGTDESGSRSASSTATATSSGSSGTSSRSTSSDRQRARTGGSTSGSGAGSATSSSETERTASESSTERRSTAQEAGGTTAGAETEGSSQWTDLSGSATRQNADESSTPAGVRRRRGLRRWYGVVLVALLSYVGGVGAYLLANRGDALALVSELQTAPVPTLLGALPLQSPTAFALAAANGAAAGSPGLGLLLLVGTALLPLVVLTAVAQFGHGSAWAYALASLGPVATLATYPFVVLPAGAVLLGLVVLPLVSGLGFLVDVGRYLLATR